MPLVLVEFAGAVNPDVAPSKELQDRYGPYGHYTASRAAVHVSEPVAEWLTGLGDARRAEVAWLSDDDDVRDLAQAARLPDYARIARPADADGDWWKLQVVRDALDEHRPVVWVDPGIGERLGRQLRNSHPTRVLTITPPRHSGMLPAEIGRADAFIDTALIAGMQLDYTLQRPA